MRNYRIWDLFIRVFHWSLVAAFAANALFIDDESGLHRWVGYGIALLVALRLVWGLLGPRHARFTSFPPSLSGVIGQLTDMATGRVRVHLGHTPLGALMIYNLLLTMLVIATSGFMMTTLTFWGMDWVEELHEASVAWAEISVLLHVAAVMWESWRSGVNLPRSMVTGIKSVPEGRPVIE